MLYFSEQELDELLLEDIYRGDLTTQALELNHIQGKMIFKRKNAGIVAGINVAKKLLQKLELEVQLYVADGDYVEAQQVLMTATGQSSRLQQGWKVVQCVLEWSCGVAQYMAEMRQNAQQQNPNARVLCTRKSIPGTRKLATNAILAAGGQIHRQGLSETVLVFTNHRNLMDEPTNWQKMVAKVRHSAPENKVTIEADNFEQFQQILATQPDLIQLDKFSLDEVKAALELVKQSGSQTHITVAGGINKNNIADYAKLGMELFITSAPYYAKPEDIKVIIQKIN